MDRLRRHRERPPRGKLFVPKVSLADYLYRTPLLSPKEIDNRLSTMGYEGQERARRSACLAAYRHIKRLKLLHVKKIPRDKLPPRSNAIFIGPTGCGKSYIIELLFGKILKLPYVITEMTRYTETGYVGDSIMNILIRLVEAAHDNIQFAQCGIVVLDEFDKIAARTSLVRFGGAGTTKDVSGYGVQRELLKMIEGAEIEVGVFPGFLRHDSKNLSTRDITFFASGAFSGFKTIGNTGKMIGFNSEITMDGIGDGVQYRIGKKESEDIGKFQDYGFIPELIARFDRIIPFQPLDGVTLKKILKNRLERIKVEFEEEGFDLRVDKSIYDFIVKEAINRQTGARGIDSAITGCIEDIGFEYFGQGKTGTVTLKMRKGQLKSVVKVKVR